MKYKHISSRYVSLTGVLWSLPELINLFEEFRTKHPTVYKDFRTWIDNMTEIGMLFPI